MIVTLMQEVNSKKYKIYLEDEQAFILYKGEVRRYQIREGEDLSEEIYDEIKREVISKRARRRVMYLLQSMDRTSKQIELKLRQNQYPDWAIEDAIAYVTKYGYLNDERYARLYVENHARTKSRRQIEMELLRKGIDSSVLASVMEIVDNQIDECEIIQRWIEKKKIDPVHASKESLYKLYRFLLQKGFSYENIDKKLRLYRHNV